jgi:hypothetical protein
MNKPYFVAIGPQKTGTSWLYKMLRKHPMIELPPIKEIRYFWEKAFIQKNDVFSQLFSRHWHFKKKRAHIIRRFKMHFRLLIRRKLSWSDVRWDFRYFFYPHGDNWYLNLFSNGKISGDLTPQYYELPEKEIGALKNLNPDVKIIIGLRDPVDRDWSSIRMYIRNNGKSIADEEFISHIIRHKIQNNLIDYVELVNKWSKYFPSNNIFIFFYEQLLDDPAKLFDDLCSFLKIDLIDIGSDSKEKVNKGMELEIPEKYLTRLIELNLDYLKKMPNYFTQNYPQEWLKKYQDILLNANVLAGHSIINNTYRSLR